MEALATVHSYHGTSLFTDKALQCSIFEKMNLSENDTVRLGISNDVDAWMVNSMESGEAL